jgi:hypothetical protein
MVEGELVQRLTGGTGEPALSPDGTRLAIVLRSLTGPSRLVVWPTRPGPDSTVQRARERMLRLDPLDVAPFDSFPRPRRALATLHPFRGRSHEQPRWMPDGINILVTRDEPAPNGVTRPDLFMWNTRSGLRRLTRGASVRQVDPRRTGAKPGVRACRHLRRGHDHAGPVRGASWCRQSGPGVAPAAAQPDGAARCQLPRMDGASQSSRPAQGQCGG